MQVSTLYSSLRQGQILVVNLPIRPWDQPSTVRGVLSMGIHLDGALLQEMLARYSVHDGFLLLTDREGRILARQGRQIPGDLIRARLDPPPIPGRRPATWTRLGEQEFLVTALAFPQLEGFLVVGRSRAGIVTVVNDLARDLLGLALIPLLGAGLLAWLLADRYLTQILALLHGLRQVGAGILSSRVEVASDDELGEAAQAFNTMAEGLERNHLVEELWKERWTPPA
jgi:HAMP domain-containing protein